MKLLSSFCIFLIIISYNLYSQSYYIEKIDSVLLTKAQIYSHTKEFIAKQWVSANDVIQNDDKEGGVIILKCLTYKPLKVFGADYGSTYAYNITFRIKDHKYKIVVDNLHCHKMGLNTCILPLSDGTCPDKDLSGAPKKLAIKMIDELTSELKSIVSNYEFFVKNNETKDDW